MGWTAIRWPPTRCRNCRTAGKVVLGIGIRTLVANYIPEGVEVTLQSKRYAGHRPLSL